ncbi:hypothetical protein SmJEL517_g01759 [Synchytrium microbalum]|uniref:Sugar phosphate transporter domain-containing protein n=1 Tax=Synchytrium microbalum TaxID=1806994 RepID=A0A507C3C7_9FUNG|nr:uncharacterized protein SmJEL517_g01759 [Synchytrium microbalum]TPX36020.1 hypothetical protein SmJEL517_g01759 [Synchytrium microbalum]
MLSTSSSTTRRKEGRDESEGPISDVAWMYQPVPTNYAGKSSPSKASVSINLNPHSTTLPGPFPANLPTSSFKNLLYIALWYLFSTSLSLYNKTLLGKDQYNFNLPLLMCSIHTGMQFLFCSAVVKGSVPLFCIEGFKTSFNKLDDPLPTNTVTARHYLVFVIPTALAGALDICMSNASLHYVSLPFYVMIKSSVPVFVLLFAFLFGLEKITTSLIAVIFVIVFGVSLTIVGEVHFDMFGFLLISAATIFSGLRWALTQIMLQTTDIGVDSPIHTLYYISPIMAVVIGCASIIGEVATGMVGSSGFFSGIGRGAETCGLLFGGGVLALCMTLVELVLLQKTSVVTLSVAGIAKEVFVIAIAEFVFGDMLNFIQYLGVGISIIGIAAYNYLRLSAGHGHGHGHSRTITVASRPTRKIVSVRKDAS